MFGWIFVELSFILYRVLKIIEFLLFQKVKVKITVKAKVKFTIEQARKA
jgi:hypothetical protein